MEKQDLGENNVNASRQIHGKASYYHSDVKLSEEIKDLIHQDVLLNDPNGPRLVKHNEERPKEIKVIEITNYVFMNDGVWMKVIIDSEKYPALKDVTIDDLKCTFEEEAFYFEANISKLNEKYALAMPRTREKIFPDKSKYYIRKNKIYIALYKQKEEDWWTLKGV